MPTYKTRRNYYFQGLVLLWSYWLASCTVFLLFRFIFLLRFGNFEQLLEYWPDIFEAFWVGFKFDSKVISIALVPFIVIHILLLVSRWLSHYWQRGVPYFLALLTFVFYTFLFIDQLYYSYFQNHIDIHAFALLEDDTTAILISAWREFPLLRNILLLLGVYGLSTWLLFCISRWSANLQNPLRKWSLQLGLGLFCILFSVLNIRGSLSVFPLTRDDQSISFNQFLNFLAYNGIFSFGDAWFSRQKNHYSTDMTHILHKYEHVSVDEAFKNYYPKKQTPNWSRSYASQKAVKKTDASKPKPELDPAIEEYLFRPLVTSSDATAPRRHDKNAQYHVLLIIMESWSSYYLQLHSSQLNLLGDLAKHMSELIHFTNFYSSANGTIYSLESIFLGNPDNTLIQSKYATLPFRTSIARPFKQQAYQTFFITSGKLHWRNLNTFLLPQGFDVLVGKAYLESYYEQAQNNEWGVFDEYIYNYAWETLNKAEKPVFITTLSTTHHPPYNIPKHYEIAPLRIPPQLKKDLLTEPSIAQRAFGAFQYANHALGVFLSKIRNSALRDKVIIAITGDHNTWALFNYDQTKFHWKYAVPLMLYLPPALKRQAHINHQRFASHIDILPTLHALAIPQAEVLRLGNDLLNTKEQYYFAYNNAGWAFDQYGAVKTWGSPIYYKWDSRQRRKLQGASATPALQRLRKRTQAQNVLLNYIIRQSIAREYPKQKYARFLEKVRP